MYQLTVKSHFDAAHKLEGYKGACANLHGHTFKYQVVLESEKLDKMDMVVDFKDVKAQLKVLETRLDHKYLNESLMMIRPTAEALANVIFLDLRRVFGSMVKKVEVWESDECSVSYWLDDENHSNLSGL